MSDHQREQSGDSEQTVLEEYRALLASVGDPVGARQRTEAVLVVLRQLQRDFSPLVLDLLQAIEDNPELQDIDLDNLPRLVALLNQPDGVLLWSGEEVFKLIPLDSSGQMSSSRQRSAAAAGSASAPEPAAPEAPEPSDAGGEEPSSAADLVEVPPPTPDTPADAGEEDHDDVGRDNIAGGPMGEAVLPGTGLKSGALAPGAGADELGGDLVRFGSENEAGGQQQQQETQPSDDPSPSEEEGAAGDESTEERSRRLVWPRSRRRGRRVSRD